MAETKHQPRITGPRNTTRMAPAVMAPPEILVLIFTASVTQENVDDGSRQVIACSQVCQFWREVTLSTPALWTRINLQHPASEEFSIRSQPLPIQITLEEAKGYRAFSTDKSIRRAAWLTPDVSRVQGLIACASSPTLQKIVSLFGPIAPNISNIDIRFMPIPGDMGFPFFANFAPNVRRLTLWMVDADLDVYGNLTQISFNCVCPSQLSILPLATIILLLQRSPRLQSLHLFNMYLDNEQGTGATTVVELAFIESFILADVVGVVDLLNHIFIPASAPILGYRPIELKTLSTDDRKNCQMTSTGRTLRLAVYECDDDTRHNRSFTLMDNNLVSHDIQPIILVITSCLALSQAKIGALTIETLPDESGALSTPLPVDSWKTILSALPEIHLILFSDDSSRWTPNFLLAISPSASNTQNQLPCPTMRSLQLCPTSDFSPDSPMSSLGLAWQTIQSLEARAAFGTSLWILKIPFGDDETATKLKSLVYHISFSESMDD